MNLTHFSSEVETHTGIKVRHYRRIMTGWEHLILEVNGDYIFRIPLLLRRSDRLKKEVSLVNSLSKFISTPLPKYDFFWQSDQDPSLTFAGYRKLSGVPCNSRNFRRSWIRKTGKDLGRFLSELHSVSSSNRTMRNLPRYSPKNWINRLRESHSDVKKFAYPLIKKEYHQECESIWSSLFSNLERTKFQPSLIHGDLVGPNILVGPQEGKLTGIVDWSDARIADPAYDFAGLRCVSPQVEEFALSCYDRDQSGIKERADLYFRTIPLREMAWGEKQGSKRVVRIGLEEFNRWFRQPS